jgi:quinone-modifying oxidoreductase subunit QmoA
MPGNGKRGTVLVVGGGISGISTAIELAEVGCEVILVEKAPSLGGRVAQFHQYFPKLCPPACGLEINVRRIKTNPRIRCVTLAEVTRVSGGPGDYQATIRRQPRRVNAKCTACGACVDVCPVERPSAFDFGMSTTKAIYLPHQMAYPLQFAIDGDVCLGEECAKCVSACQYDAIDLGMQSETEEVNVQAVVWATGWRPFDATRLEPLGFGRHPNVITNVMMERLAATGGPTGGRIQRPSDGKGVEAVAFVQCAGSRDENYLRHCSGVCCLASLKQVRYVREQYPDAKIYVFYIDIRAPGRLEDFFVTAKQDEQLTLIKGKVAKITEGPAAGDLVVEAEDALSGERVRQQVSLVVLATGLVPVGGGGVQVEAGLLTDEDGFLLDEQPQGARLAAGCAKRPTEVGACVRDATGVAARALHYCTG